MVSDLGEPKLSTWTEWSTMRSTGTTGFTRSLGIPRATAALRRMDRSTNHRNAGKILQQDAFWIVRELDLVRKGGPVGQRDQRREVGVAPVVVPDDVLEEDPHRSGPPGVPGGVDSLQAVRVKDEGGLAP